MEFLILEDNTIQGKELSKNIIELFPHSNVVICKNSSSAIYETQTKIYDVFLIDIELKNENGLSFAKTVLCENQENNKKIIFTTAHKKYAISAINETHCHSYLVKPYNKKTLFEAIQSVTNYNNDHSNPNSYLKFSLNKIKHIVNKNKIIYIETHKKKPWIHTNKAVIEMPRYSLSKLLKKLNEGNASGFMQCRRDCVANIQHISEVTKIDSIYYIKFINGKKLPVGAKYKDNIFDILKS